MSDMENKAKTLREWIMERINYDLDTKLIRLEDAENAVENARKEAADYAQEDAQKDKAEALNKQQESINLEYERDLRILRDDRDAYKEKLERIRQEMQDKKESIEKRIMKIREEIQNPTCSRKKVQELELEACTIDDELPFLMYWLERLTKETENDYRKS